MSGDNRKELAVQEALDLARTEGWRVVVPTTKQLLIDIDNTADLEQFNLAFDYLSKFNLFGPKGFSQVNSKSGIEGRLHITVDLSSAVTPVERIALQAILGSDWKREFHSMRRIQEGDTVPTLFFEKP